MISARNLKNSLETNWVTMSPSAVGLAHGGIMNAQLFKMGLPVLAMAVVGLSAGQATAQANRAGTAPFPAHSAGITIALTPPMPDGCYSVSVQQTNTAGYSPTAVCTYFNVLKKTATQFQVQHKSCHTGAPLALIVPVSLDWQISQNAVLGAPCGKCGSGTYHEHCGATGTCNLVCADDSISDGSCTDDSDCGSNLPICVGTDACTSPRFCYKPCS